MVKYSFHLKQRRLKGNIKQRSTEMKMTLVFVGIKSLPGKANSVISSLSQHTLVKETYKVYDGQYDIVMIIDVPTLSSYNTFVQEVLAHHQGIADFESFIAV